MKSQTGKPRLGIIGTGKVGQTLAIAWHKAGYRISAVHNRTTHSAQKLAQKMNAQVTTVQDLCSLADLILLSVPDNEIATVAEKLARYELSWQGKAIVHTSGATSLDPLLSLAEQGAMVGSLHPAFPFASVEKAVNRVYGATFAVETQDDLLQNWLHSLISSLDGHSITIPAGKKALYHVALVFASNYTVTLFDIAKQLLHTLDADPQAVQTALSTLVSATADNLASQSTPDALTGPLLRADTDTLTAHLHALENATALDNHEDIRQLYLALAKLTLPMVKQRDIETDTLDTFLQDNSG